MNNLLKNPLFRIIGILAILYFALFHNTEKRNSLGNRFSVSNVKEDITEIKEKSDHIVSSLQKAKEMQTDRKKVKSYDKQKKSESFNITVKNIKIGQGKQVKCNNFVSINYKVFINNKDLEQLAYVENYQFIVGNKEVNEIIAGEVIDMRKGGVKLITIPNNYESNNEDIIKYLEKGGENTISYEITLIDRVSRYGSKKYKC